MILLRFFILTFFLILSISASYAQKSITYFDVILEGKTVGEMVATKEIIGDTVKLELHSNVETKIFLLSIEVESETEMLRVAKVLIEGASFQHANHGKANITTTIKKTGKNTYKTTKNGKNRIIRQSQIMWTLTDMYFDEPVGVTSVFSIADADFLTINSTGNGKYELLLSNGKKNIFTYSQGTMIEMETKIVVGNLIIRKR